MDTVAMVWRGRFVKPFTKDKLVSKKFKAAGVAQRKKDKTHPYRLKQAHTTMMSVLSTVKMKTKFPSIIPVFDMSHGISQDQLKEIAATVDTYYKRAHMCQRCPIGVDSSGAASDYLITLAGTSCCGQTL